MDALSVITLDQAKTHLVVLNDTFYDSQIGGVPGQSTGLIGTAISMVEQYTNYYLYQRSKSYPIYNERTEICDFPLQITALTDRDGNPIPSFNIRLEQKALSMYVCTYSCGGVISAEVGYSDPTQIPQPLISAAYKILTYLFENKDAYSAELPVDVQLMLNQWRRSASI